MFIPDLQLRGEGLATQFLGKPSTAGEVGLMVGFGQSVYSIAQLLTGTWLGRLSDIKGRRIILLGSSALSIFAYALYAHADTIWLLWLSRALSGIAAANLGVAFAYVADVTSPEERGPKLGLLGAAFGVGFIIGPALGAGLLVLGKDSPLLLGYTAAILSAINFVLIYILVKESNTPRQDAGKKSFLMNLSFTNLETTDFRLLADPNWIFKVAQETVKTFGSVILLVVGITGAITQGGLSRIIIPKLGELKTVRIFYTAFIPVFASVPYIPMYFPGIFGTIALGLTNGLAMPSMNSLVSRRAPREMQGSIMGLTQSLGSLARIIGPLFANWLFQMKPSYPYLYGAALALIPAVLAWFVLKPSNPATDNEPTVGMAH